MENKVNKGNSRGPSFYRFLVGFMVIIVVSLFVYNLVNYYEFKIKDGVSASANKSEGVGVTASSSVR